MQHPPVLPLPPPPSGPTLLDSRATSLPAHPPAHLLPLLRVEALRVGARGAPLAPLPGVVLLLTAPLLIARTLPAPLGARAARAGGRRTLLLLLLLFPLAP